MAKQHRAAETSPKAAWPQPNPALKDLEVLVGEWSMAIFDAPWLPSAADKLEGFAAFSWAQDGAFLAVRQGAKPPIPPEAAWLIGRDEAVGEYEAFYYDARGVSRIYKMSFDGGLWKLWRDVPGFLQRFEGQVSADANHIEARWEKSVDGKPWEQDFKLTYTRIT